MFLLFSAHNYLNYTTSYIYRQIFKFYCETIPIRIIIALVFNFNVSEREIYMLFNSYIFIFLFFPLTLLGYYSLNYAHKYKSSLIFLTGMSLWFYGYNNIYYLLILIVSIILNYGIISGMAHYDDVKMRRFFLCSGLIWNIGVLFLFKYYDFFIDNINSALHSQLPFLRLALPLGISFYTFQQISYVIDYYKRECNKYSFIEYIAYVSYFPQLIAGPIVYHDELIPQFRDISKKQINYDNLCKGVYAFSLGLAKKVLLADTFSKVVTIGYGNISELNTPSVILTMVCYSLQIYFDFSGYCDMAYGIAYMMNIELPQNFNSPYKAGSVSEFWDRWHITLTRFFTKYVYIPLGGSRVSTARTYSNIFFVFLISGLWHGANWTFILWGALHGIAKVIERFLNIRGTNTSKWIKAFRICCTFVIITLAWSLFRAESLSDTFLLWKQLFTGGFGPIYQPIISKFHDLTEVGFLYRIGLGSFMDSYPFVLPSLFTGISLLTCMTIRNTQEKVSVMKLTSLKLITVVVLMLWSIVSLAEISVFLYFNF